MPADARVTYRKRNPFNTRSNYFRKVRTPGGRIVIQYLKKLHLKQRSVPKCADTGKPLRGVLPNRGNYKNRRLTHLQTKRKAVTRPYGGNLSHMALRSRIIRAFLTEESRIVRKINRTRREKLLQGKVRPKKKRVIKKKKAQPKPVAKAAEPPPTEPRKLTKHEEKVARREVRRDKRKVKQAKKQDAEEQAKKAPQPKHEPEDDSGKKKKKPAKKQPEAKDKESKAKPKGKDKGKQKQERAKGKQKKKEKKSSEAPAGGDNETAEKKKKRQRKKGGNQE